MLAKRRLEVRQRREDALTRPVTPVHDAVQDLHPVMAHPERISVGKRQAYRSLDLRMILADAVLLAARVLRGGLDRRQNAAGDERLQVAILHLLCLLDP